MHTATLEEAFAIVKKAGIKITTKKIVLRRREMARINKGLTLYGKLVVTHNGKRVSVFSFKGCKARKEAAAKGSAASATPKPTA